jgi:hypothetical protein
MAVSTCLQLEQRTIKGAVDLRERDRAWEIHQQDRGVPKEPLRQLHTTSVGGGITCAHKLDALKLYPGPSASFHTPEATLQDQHEERKIQRTMT